MRTCLSFLYRLQPIFFTGLGCHYLMNLGNSNDSWLLEKANLFASQVYFLRRTKSPELEVHKIVLCGRFQQTLWSLPPLDCINPIASGGISKASMMLPNSLVTVAEYACNLRVIFRIQRDHSQVSGTCVFRKGGHAHV